jgi:signal transduction histidine kinase
MLSGNLTLSQGSLDDPEKTRDFIRKELAITETIGRQILFTRDYESLGTRDPSWQNIGGLVREAAATINTGEVRVETAAADFEMYADPLLGKVFYNLIDNALRYGGSAMTTIRVSAVPSGTGLIVVFEDNGAGIPAEEKSRIFERGYGKNTGLGLFLAREILDLTGCTITETGNAGQGARFEIRVPAGDFRPVAGARRPGFSPAPDQFHPPLVR